jgi:uncharacterized protein
LVNPPFPYFVLLLDKVCKRALVWEEGRELLTITIISLMLLGFLVGTFGTLIGAGGGFILVPVLLIMYPEQAPETITAISLAVVFFNALSGTVAYGWQKRIDFRSGLIFSVATVPGSVLGAWLVHFTPRDVFDFIFGIILVALAVFLILKPTRAKDSNAEIPLGHVIRKVTDSDFVEHVYGYHLWSGIAISLFVGLLAGFLGIGGGIIHVPALVSLLSFPVHIATATSQFMLGIMSFSGSLVHLVYWRSSPTTVPDSSLGSRSSDRSASGCEDFQKNSEALILFDCWR